MGILSYIKDAKQKQKAKTEAKHRETFSNAQSNFEIKSTEMGEFNEFLDKFKNHSLIMLIIGRRGAGKTALGMKFVEVGKIFKKRSYVIGFDNSKVPMWVKKAGDIKEIPNNSLVLIDEAGITFSARDSMKTQNKKLAELLDRFNCRQIAEQKLMEIAHLSKRGESWAESFQNEEK